MIGLKAFVAAIIGGLVSYPLTALGALAVGVVESFASFWSGALKDVIVFSLLIPVLMLRSFCSAACRGGRRGDRRMTAPRPRIAAHRPSVVVAAGALAPLRRSASFTRLAAQRHRHRRAGRARPGAAHRHRRRDLVRPGRVRRHRRLCDRLADHGARLLALARPRVRAGCSPALAALAIGMLTLRLGGHFLPLSTIAWGLSIAMLFGNVDALGRHTGLSEHPAAAHRRLVAGRSARDLLPDLGRWSAWPACSATTCCSRGRAARSAACAAARCCWRASAPTRSACGSRCS